MRVFFKYIWIFIFNLLLILYLSELLFTIFVKPKITSYIDLDYQRYQKAKELGVNFDTRPHFQTFIEEKKKEPSLSPNYYFAQNRGPNWGRTGFYPSIQNFIQSKLDNNDLIPLSGPINKKSMDCNEDGRTRINDNDKYGYQIGCKLLNKKLISLNLG